MQPLDTMVSGILKKQYHSWLGKYLLKEGSITEEKAILQISELFASLGQNAIDYAFRLTGIPKFKFLNQDYNGLDEDKKEEYLVERFEELALREENMKVNGIEINVTEKDCREASNEKEFQKKSIQPKQSKITSFFKKN